ncbi:MAG: amino acid ABC transporter substrate-binding protein [bacterium]|nr:amino acid ABC transporter substrate-binding protein [bacterium]
MLEDPLSFSGPEGEVVEPSTLSAVSIGLFAPFDEENRAANDVYRGALLAVEQANAGGGFRGVDFHIVRRWAKDPWGAGSKEMIRLVYSDRVWTVIAFNGGAGHIAQQVAAKVHIPVIAPISTGHPLTRARVPWIFRLPPDDKVQARVLVKDGIVNRHIRRVGLVSGTGHDSRVSGKEMRNELERRNLPPVFHFELPPALSRTREIVERIRDFQPDGLILCLEAPLLVKLLNDLQLSGITCPVITPWVPGTDSKELQIIYKNSLMIEPFEQEKAGVVYQTFNRDFEKRFGAVPAYSAAYSYDAARMIILAIRSKGLNRPAIRRGLAGLSGHNGASGRIIWNNGNDPAGGR